MRPPSSVDAETAGATGCPTRTTKRGPTGFGSRGPPDLETPATADRTQGIGADFFRSVRLGAARFGGRRFPHRPCGMPGRSKRAYGPGLPVCRKVRHCQCMEGRAIAGAAARPRYARRSCGPGSRQGFRTLPGFPSSWAIPPAAPVHPRAARGPGPAAADPGSVLEPSGRDPRRRCRVRAARWARTLAPAELPVGARGAEPGRPPRTESRTRPAPPLPEIPERADRIPDLAVSPMTARAGKRS